MGKEKAKYGDTADFIKTNMKLVSDDPEHIRYQVNKEHYTEFLKGRGITKESIAQFDDAQTEFYNGTISVVKDLMIEQPEHDRIMLNTRTHNGVLSTRIARKVETRVPVTGEPLTKFGVVSLKINLKSHMDKELIKECADEIKAACNQ